MGQEQSGVLDAVVQFLTATGRLCYTRGSLGPLSRTNQRTGLWSQPTVLFILSIAERRSLASIARSIRGIGINVWDKLFTLRTIYLRCNGLFHGLQSPLLLR